MLRLGLAIFKEQEVKLMRFRLERLLKRVRDRLEYRWRRFRNKPMCFHWVVDEGEAVGEPIDIYHLTLHDMAEHQARGKMTYLLLVQGARVNAIQTMRFERLNELSGKITIQPCWVERFGPVRT